MLVSQKIYPGLITYPITNDTWTKLILRTFISAFVLTPWVLLKYSIKKSDISSPYAALLVWKIIPALGIGASFFCFSDIVSKKLGVLPENEKSKKDDD